LFPYVAERLLDKAADRLGAGRFRFGLSGDPCVEPSQIARGNANRNLRRIDARATA